MLGQIACSCWECAAWCRTGSTSTSAVIRAPLSSTQAWETPQGTPEAALLPHNWAPHPALFTAWRSFGQLALTKCQLCGSLKDSGQHESPERVPQVGPPGELWVGMPLWDFAHPTCRR